MPRERNFNNIQFAELRNKVDHKYNDVHDELTECYYGKKPFRTYGILDKATFDKLHGLIFHMRDKEFHEENLKQPEVKRIPEEKYNHVRNPKNGETVEKINEFAVKKIDDLKKEGIELTI